MIFPRTAFCSCLSSEHYNEEEYIRDMDEFMQEKDVYKWQLIL